MAVPVIQTNSQDSKLRPENVLFLETVLGEQEKALLRLDEVLAMLQDDNPATTWRLSKQNNVAFALVDHNHLTPFWGGATRYVYSIVDHHEDEGEHDDAVLRVVHGPTSSQSAGSCASLVTLVYSNEVVHKAQKGSSALASIGASLLGPIMLDTKALKRVDQGGKATKWDDLAVDLLFDHATQCTPATEDFDRQAQPDWSLLVWDLLASGGIRGGCTPNKKIEALLKASRSPGDLGLREQVKALKPGWKALKEAKSSAPLLLTPAELLRRDAKAVHVDGVDIGGNRKTLRLTLATLPTSIPMLVYDRFDLFPQDPSAHQSAWTHWWVTVADFAKEQGSDMVLGLCASKVSVSSQAQDDTEKALPTPPSEDDRAQSSDDDNLEVEGKDKKIRELIIMAISSSQNKAQSILQALTKPLEQAENAGQAGAKLQLQLPWSYPLPSATKKQVKRWLFGAVPGSGVVADQFDSVPGLDQQGSSTLAYDRGAVAFQVYRQLNQNANRKVVLPALLSALQPERLPASHLSHSGW